ncbi:serine/threonine-protein phosphatase 7 long form homolog [Vicia villosa]|uniref:serine/threonine-protein phosphatase 7 long form homolog n=1 Tax=Vicia villosa TaxID=3911 RepID=UPI00273C5FA7|nr:serine/threonine-protein phosphatase 7 long form homolog [Vicia villosa]
MEPYSAIIPYLISSGLYHVTNIHSTQIDNRLILALLERWRPETHTFHLPTGECTITLEDVSMLLGLPIEGTQLNGPSELDDDVWPAIVGETPPQNALHGSAVRLTWLKGIYQAEANRPTEEHKTRHARIYIMILIGQLLFPDKSGSHVHPKWSQFLFDFNQEMCKACEFKVKEISGCLLLLQAWAFTSMPIISPKTAFDSTFPHAARWCVKGKNFKNNPRDYLQGYRFLIDHMQPNQFIWRPYLRFAPPQDEDSSIWSAKTYIICFHIVEMHQSDRVKLQFGYLQNIPDTPVCLKEHHKMNTNKSRKTPWTELYRHEQ